MSIHFIIGTGRCGSSLIHEILARHDAVAFISNVDDNLPGWNLNGRFNNVLYRATRGGFTRKGGLRFAPSEAYRLIAAHVSPLYADSCRDLTAQDVTPWLAARFTELFEERRRAQRKPLLLHKYTGWPRMGFFGGIFPEAKFVNIVRDGRAVANSLLQMPWWSGYRGPEHWSFGPLSQEYREEWERSDRSFVVLAGIAWKILMDAFAASARELGGGRYLEIRYEDFVAQPQVSLDQMTGFFGMPPAQSLTKALEQQRLDGSRRRAFERDLTSAQLAALNASLGPMLTRYGYDV